MKRIYKLSVSLMVLLGLLSIPVLSTAGEVSKEEEIRTMEKVETIRNWKLMDVLNLSQDRAQKVFTILRKFDLQRRKLIQERRSLREKLIKASRGEAVKGDVRGIALRYLNVGVELAKLRVRELQALEKELSPQEEAKYVLFTERFNREIMRMIIRERMRRGRRRGMGAPEGPEGPRGPKGPFHKEPFPDQEQ